MIFTIIKFFFITACCIYAYVRLLNISLNIKIIVSSALSSVFVATASYFAREYLSPANLFITVFLIILFNLIRYKKSVNLTVAFTIISLGISYFAFTAASLLSSPVAYLILSSIDNAFYSELISLVFVGIIQLLLTILLFTSKRLKSKFILLEEKITGDAGVLISVSFIFIASLFYIDHRNNALTAVLILLMIFCGFSLIFWWRRRITNIYLKKVRLRNIKSLEQSLSACQKETDSLRFHHDELAKIIHKDNKLIPALEMSVEKLISMYSEQNIPDDLKKNTQQIAEELRNIASDRRATVIEYENENSNLHPTKLISIDAILFYMRSKAEKSDIDFSLSVTDEISEYIKDIIDENQLNTLVADLLENAMIAVNHSDNIGKIHITLGFSNGCFGIEVSDNGIPFKTETLLNIGVRRSTTHKADGGSGIGLMTAFEICRKHKASFEIIEADENSDFTKSVVIRFDGLSEYRLKSSQKKLIESKSTRNDLVFI